MIFLAVFLVNNSLSGRVIFVVRIIAASSWPRDSIVSLDDYALAYNVLRS